MQGKFYSYEACSTPPRNQCFNSNSPNQNFGEGDFVPGGGYPSGGRPPIGAGPGPIGGGGGNRPLGAILGIRTAGENGETPAEGENSDPDKITFAEA